MTTTAPTYAEIAAKPLIWASEGYGNQLVQADRWKEAQAAHKEHGYRGHVIVVEMHVCRDGTAVNRFELRG
jgi:hypothetical protein